ncbi:MAG: type III-B CRISPR module RAMP protein Cmr4 [Meiothermus sp.]|uniref:type III-B CRISPR module RAMP protein Cmr4 n=1 Tax=Meiothermus sp. TaxID=1955249 RepID=UPI0025D00372|nr:type III-B CRISPR module RAMP protein Cmr4 [Meiothermus sp.]MCS7069582.1 type III-B CRISPR module RAMP protein Cmr4 [Meiothermus sp.]MDW8425977.1 type III-B CRISPR module RAMP protein Cmr4 [Meiothermus sp.]
MNTYILFLHALSPLHPGTGQGVGGIDLPIARERSTGIPYLPGSSIKGVLRDTAASKLAKDKLLALFGPETGSASEHAGAAVFGDARLLLLPVRSLAGVFAYVTSPYLLERFAREAGFAGLTPPALPAAPASDDQCHLPPESALKLGDKVYKVYLEDLDLSYQEAKELAEWGGWLAQHSGAQVKRRLCLVHDDVMGFLLETATEVVARIRLEDETKTVADKALWYEESLPAESLLYSLISLGSSRKKAVEVALDDLKSLLGYAQMGGKASVGRGLCRLKLGGSA